MEGEKGAERSDSIVVACRCAGRKGEEDADAAVVVVDRVDDSLMWWCWLLERARRGWPRTQLRLPQQ